MSESQLPDNFWLAMRYHWLSSCYLDPETRREMDDILERFGRSEYEIYGMVVQYTAAFVKLIDSHHPGSACLSKVFQRFLPEEAIAIPSANMPSEVNIEATSQSQTEVETVSSIRLSLGSGGEISQEIVTRRTHLCEELSRRDVDCRCYENISVQRVEWNPINDEDLMRFFQHKMKKICKNNREFGPESTGRVLEILYDAPTVKTKMEDNKKAGTQQTIFQVILDYCRESWLRIREKRKASSAASAASTSSAASAASTSSAESRSELVRLSEFLSDHDSIMPGYIPMQRVERLFENMDAELVEYKIQQAFGIDFKTIKKIKRDFGWFIQHAYGPDMTKFQKNVFVYEIIRRNPFAVLAIEDGILEGIFRRERSDLVMEIDKFKICRRIMKHLSQGNAGDGNLRENNYGNVVRYDDFIAALNSLRVPPSMRTQIEECLVEHFYFCFETINGERFLYRRYFHEMERFIGSYISRLSSRKMPIRDIPNSELRGLDQSQVRAVKESVKSNVSVINGPAGRGKTKVFARIAQYFEDNNISYRGIAYTHRAVRQMRRAMGTIFEDSKYWIAKSKTSTIHSLCGTLESYYRYLTQENVSSSEREKGNWYFAPFEYLLIDEAGLVYYELLYDLLMVCERLSFSFKIIFTGDNRQLPPINPGRVLDQLILGLSPSPFELTVNHRQKNAPAGGKLNDILDSLVRLDPNAEIKKARSVEFPPGKEDFCDYQAFYASAPMLVSQLGEILRRIISFNNKDDYVVIATTNADVFKLNCLVQNFLNPEVLISTGVNNQLPHPIVDENFLKVLNKAPSGTELTEAEKIQHKNAASFYLRIGDKVINNVKVVLDEEASKKFKTILAPGTEGIVKSFDQYKVLVEFEHPDDEDRSLIVPFCIYKQSTKDGKSKIYSISDLRLGYAITCNKSQGGEWEHVVFYVKVPPNEVPFAGHMNRNIVYTAISRAKTKLWLLGSPKAAGAATIKPAPQRPEFLHRRLGIEEKSQAASSVPDDHPISSSSLSTSDSASSSSACSSRSQRSPINKVLI